MIVRSLELADFRNYLSLQISFSGGTDLLYGDNAQGKTNILEAVFLSCTTKSHRGSRDKELIRFGESEAHIRTTIEKNENGISGAYQIDMHLRQGKNKGIALDGQKMRRASEFLKRLNGNVIFFSPEDLGIIKNGPSERRRFMDMELCQMDYSYLEILNRYHKNLLQRGNILKNSFERPDLLNTIDVWDEGLVKSGTAVISARERFLTDLNEIISETHARLTDGKEALTLSYEPNVTADCYETEMRLARNRDLFLKQTTVGPHRDDFSFLITKKGEREAVDARKYGSQGQQRTAALSLKLAEIELVKKKSGHAPVLLLDDVLSELDGNRQRRLLQSIGGIQTIVTCTGLDDLAAHRFAVDAKFQIVNGTAIPEEKGVLQKEVD